LASLLPVLLVFTIATFPGEWLDEILPSMPIVPTSWAPISWASPHALLVGGAVNEITQRPRSPVSNRLVVPGIDGIDNTKLRGRHLEGAVLIGAHLRKADFTGAYLKSAQMDKADLREATFACAKTGETGEMKEKQCADLRDASLQSAQLQSVDLQSAQLQGADLGEAELQGADLGEAELQGADLLGAQLQGADLDEAELQGAYLLGAQLQGADLSGAQLQGAYLFGAQLQGADLSYAQLQGADLNSAQLQDASLAGVFVWRAEAPGDGNAKGACITGLETAPKYEGLDCQSEQPCNWTAETYSKLKQLIETDVPQNRERKSALAQIARLDPGPGNKSKWQKEAWIRLQQSSPPPPKDYETALAARLQQIGCAAEDAPYVIHGLLKAGFDNRFTADPAQAGMIAQAFLNEAHCPGARGLSAEEKEALRKISEDASAAKP
jgi:uncharacterized protein YjbI with pentapeptide repeats